jgi:hexosaminidase
MLWNLTPELEKTTRLFAQEFGVSLPRSWQLTAEPGPVAEIQKNGNVISLIYPAKPRYFEELTYLFSHAKLSFHHLFPTPIHELTYLLDCSRNAVMKVSALKKLILHLAALGYDSLMLYTEDTLEVEDEPYFGYFRGAYTYEEIREIDAFAFLFGIELIPCVQTLAHLGAIKRYPAYQPIFDEADVLLADDPRTAELIDHLFASCAKAFSSRRINIGMDEAHGIGRGKYYDLHGSVDRFFIMRKHLAKVAEIASKYGFSLSMWSDMFFALVGGGYEGKNTIAQDAIAGIPQGITLIYWDYYHQDESHYLDVMERHHLFKNPLAFATGAWKWNGLAPNNRYSFSTMRPGMEAALEKKIPQVIVTGWGDNGGECSPYATLPALALASSLRHGEKEIDQKSFLFVSHGLSLDDFLLLDEVNRIYPEKDNPNNGSRMFLFNDPLLGMFDALVPSGSAAFYRQCALALKKNAEQKGPFAYLYQSLLALAEVLALKADLGLRLRAAYQNGNREQLEFLLKDIKLLLKKIDLFDRAFSRQWEQENKPEGYDIQDIRLGAVKERLKKSAEKVRHYLKNGTPIPELAHPLLHPEAGLDNTVRDWLRTTYSWREYSSVNVND